MSPGKFMVSIGLVLLTHPAHGDESMKTDAFEFVSEGRRLDGLLDQPTAKVASGVVVLVHGHGQTNAVAGDWYRDLRSRFVKLGLASLVWDKPGCGRSEGRYDHGQTVQSSAAEVVAAIAELERRDVPGSDRIGLWGISRAGWICPLVIREVPSIAFWISVSGTDEKESFGYLLESNLRIEGRSPAEARTLLDEWRRGIELFRKGASWAENQKATENLRRDPFFSEFFGETATEEGYRANQRRFMAEGHSFDEKSGLMIYVPGFGEMLRAVRCPVLALFGEKDTQVDWRRTIALYEDTIPRLTIKTFPGCNHNLRQCDTGGFRETLTTRSQPVCEGYYEAIVDWITTNELASARRRGTPHEAAARTRPRARKASGERP
jgi:alpha/beta superfamily hydrolase